MPLVDGDCSVCEASNALSLLCALHLYKCSEYDILIFSLSERKHSFNFEIDDSFFEIFESDFIEKGKAKIEIELDKNSRHIQMGFSILGNIELTCDRSLDKFEYPISVKENIIFKYAEVFEEIDENMIHIPFDYQKINVAQYIYDLISLAAPMKRLHPRYENSEDDLTVYSTQKDNEEEKEETSIDPRWKELEKLIDKKK